MRCSSVEAYVGNKGLVDHANRSQQRPRSINVRVWKLDPENRKISAVPGSNHEAMMTNANQQVAVCTERVSWVDVLWEAADGCSQKHR